MLRRSLFPAAFLLGALALSSASASADVPPPDQCNTAGEACSTAPPDYKSPGTCTAKKCQKALPDGSVEYDCNLCVPSGSAGAGGGAGTGGGSATGGSTATGGSKSSSSSDDGGCSIGTPSAERTSLLIALGLGLAGLGALRRRRP